MVEQLKAAPERLLQAPEDAIRFLLPHTHLTSTFGDDGFGRLAERLARFFGTPKYIAAQTFIVILWVVFNGYSILVHFDKYPFIFLNLAFSTQAAYAAPLILLAQTRQASRDKVLGEKLEMHREKTEHNAEQRVARLKRETDKLEALLEANTDLTRQDKELTEQVAGLTREIHALLTKQA
jgi:uncharacterized membrane protein